MKANLDWLKEYIDITEDAEILANDLSMFGVNVEEVIGTGEGFKGVVFGKVLEVLNHPNADKLKVCKVDAGKERPLSIVCGAPNVRPGIGVPVAVDGSVLPGGFKIKKTKLRGEVSEGMICSEAELKVGLNSSGIMELDLELDPGNDISPYLSERGIVLDIEVTPNRPDLLSQYGIAREIAALYRRSLRKPELLDMRMSGEFGISVEDPEDCPRYSAALIDDVVIDDSPEWMKKRLISVGVKPVNNIVDITNYVLMEIGQPLHAFDRDRLSEDTIFVRRAKDGESIKTLDGVERKLSAGNLVITDSHLPVAVAGVMGGEETEVTEGTKRILLESAVFNPTVVRHTRQALGIETEASYRFERGGDREVTALALKRACRLVEDLGAGRVRTGYSDAYSDQYQGRLNEIEVRSGKVNRIMGTNLSSEEIAEHLERLQLKPIIKEKNIKVLVPSFRLDLKEEIDIVEEVARAYGYENIKGEGNGLKNIFPRIDQANKRNEFMSDYLACRGYAEVITSSFMDSSDRDAFDWPKGDIRNSPVEISNPLTSSQSVLRTSLLPGLLRVVANNPISEQKGIRLFEIGKVFLPVGGGNGLPGEELHLAAVFTRKAFPKNWIIDNREYDFFDMKGELESILGMFYQLESLKMVRKEEEKPAFIFNWYEKNTLVAECGKIPAHTAKRYDIETATFYFVILLDLLDPEFSSPTYLKPSPYPAVKRDLCVVTEERVTFADISNVIIRNSKYLEEISLFDYYQGEKMGGNRRSYTFTLSFRSEKSTLKDSKIDKIIEKILRALETELKVTLRSE